MMATNAPSRKTDFFILFSDDEGQQHLLGTMVPQVSSNALTVPLLLAFFPVIYRSGTPFALPVAVRGELRFAARRRFERRVDCSLSYRSAGQAINGGGLLVARPGGLDGRGRREQRRP